MLLPRLLVPQRSSALMKVSTQPGTSVWPSCSLPRAGWETPAPVGQQEYITRSTDAQQVMVSFCFFLNFIILLCKVDTSLGSDTSLKRNFKNTHCCCKCKRDIDIVSKRFPLKCSWIKLNTCLLQVKFPHFDESVVWSRHHHAVILRNETVDCFYSEITKTCEAMWHEK